LELPVMVVVAAMWLAGAVLLESWVLALFYVWALLA